MPGNGIATYLTAAALTPWALSTSPVISVWMLLVRLAVMVLPARPAGPVMPEPGSASTAKLLAWQAVPATRTDAERVLRLPLDVGDVVAAADDVHRAVQHVRQRQRVLRDDLRRDREVLLAVAARMVRKGGASSMIGSTPTVRWGDPGAGAHSNGA